MSERRDATASQCLAMPARLSVLPCRSYTCPCQCSATPLICYSMPLLHYARLDLSVPQRYDSCHCHNETLPIHASTQLIFAVPLLSSSLPSHERAIQCLYFAVLFNALTPRFKSPAGRYYSLPLQCNALPLPLKSTPLRSVTLLFLLTAVHDPRVSIQCLA